MYLNCLCILLHDYSNTTESERLKWELSRREKFYSLTKKLSVGVSQKEEVKEGGNYTGVAQVTKLQPVLINIYYATHPSTISRARIIVHSRWHGLGTSHLATACMISNLCSCIMIHEVCCIFPTLHQYCIISAFIFTSIMQSPNK